MLDSVRISLKVLNAAQLALVAAGALALAWIGTAMLGTGPAADGAQRAALAGARAFAEAVDAELNGSVADARTVALLLRPEDAALGEAERSALLRDWLALNPRYSDAALIGPDGLVRAAADRRRTGSSVARQPWFARARHAGIVIATNDGDETAPFDIVLSLGMPGRSERIQLRAGPGFLDLGARLRRALDLPDTVGFTVRGADGRVLAGTPAAPWGEHRSASVPVQGGRELGSPGWIVTASASPAAAAGGLPDPDPAHDHHRRSHLRPRARCDREGLRPAARALGLRLGPRSGRRPGKVLTQRRRTPRLEHPLWPTTQHQSEDTQWSLMLQAWANVQWNGPLRHGLRSGS